MSAKPPPPPPPNPPPPWLGPPLAELIVSGAFIGVLQDIIGFVGFLEFRFRRRIVGIAVGMVFHGKLAIRAFQRRLVRIAVDTQGLIIIWFGHTQRPLCNAEIAQRTGAVRHRCVVVKGLT
jgi:hypothetical protein